MDNIEENSAMYVLFTTNIISLFIYLGEEMLLKRASEWAEIPFICWRNAQHRMTDILCGLLREVVHMYRARNKGLYVVARNFFLLLLNSCAWPCLAVA